MTPVQRAALAQIHRTGSTEGLKDRTLEALATRGYLKLQAGDLVVTPKGQKLLAGRLGNAAPTVAARDIRKQRARGTRKPAKKARDRRQTAKDKAEHLAGLKTHLEAQEKARARSMARILGPGGLAGAVKVARADGGLFTSADLETFRKAGWKIAAAGSVTSRPGASGIPGVLFREDDWVFHNPEALGPHGTARAVVLVGRIDASTVDELAAGGFDVTPAPRKLREQLHKNPGKPGEGKKVYAELVKEAKRNHALNASELAARIGFSLERTQAALLSLEAVGLAHVQGRDLFGECWAPGAPERGLFANPSSSTRRKAEKKAAAWFQDESLLTEARQFKLPDELAAVEIGRIVAIEYESDKYDGKLRVWRHEVTKHRKLHVSTDGRVLFVSPGFKVTKRGIEG